MEIQPIKTRIFKEREDLFSFITGNIKKVPERSVIVVTSKIVALSEGRTADPKTKIALIKKESDVALQTKQTWLTIKDGMIMASAGIDESNANGKIILLPKNSFNSAEALRKKLQKYYKVKNLGVLIVDSRIFPFRAGVVGGALGYAGFKGIRNYIGTKDIFGRKLTMSRTNVADSLASAAVLEMGEGNEQQPLALITNARIEFMNKTNPKELLIDKKDDMFFPLLKNIK